MGKTVATWLDTLRDEIEAMDVAEVHDPGGEVGEKENVVGEATPRLKKLWGLQQRLNYVAEDATITLRRHHGSPESRTMLYKKASAAATKAKMVRELFWIELKHEFDLMDKSVGIREGWKVVWSEANTGFTILDMLSGG